MKTFKYSFRLFAAVFTLGMFALTNISFKPPVAENAALLPNACPTASFSISNNGRVYTEAVIFINESIGAASYHWDFGDGSFSSDDNPTHTYSSAGSYTVKLRAIVDGCTHESIGTVETVIL